MSQNDAPPTTDASRSTADEPADDPAQSDRTSRRAAMTRAAEDSTAPIALTRRGALRTTAGLSAAALGSGAGFTGGAAGNIAEGAFQQLSVSDDQKIVTEDGDPFVLRGVNIPDPKRLHRTRYLRGKTPEQVLDLVTNNEAGWHPRVVRVPAQPIDIGEHPMGHTGPEYEEDELENPAAVRDDRRKQRPPQPPAFDQELLEEYFDEYYDPIVERCRERGVYCIVDFHRHWHEQPPGEEDPGRAENHLAYDSPYTNYWARNTFSGTVEGTEIEFTTDDPASWGHVEQTWIDAHGWETWESKSQLEGTPFAAESWQVNEALRDEAIAFWAEAGERYGDMDHVIFEPYNEPAAPGIWGPVEDCGAMRQRGLWDTYLDDFVGPIVDEIRSNYDGLLLVGVPGWCQSVQALHWRTFADAGYEDVAVTWHNYAGHDVSQMHNWFNDTTYNSPEDVEAETGEALENPRVDPPESIDVQACWGWEGYEAAGLQNVMQYHPVAVTEFGWIDNPEVTDALQGTTTTGSRSNSNVYGEPFVSALEEDERISWVAWCADVRWMPTLFDADFAIDEGDLDFDNFYEPDFEELPRACEDLPCEWNLLENPNSGQYLKDRLAEHAEDTVPLELTDVSEPPPVCSDAAGGSTEVDGQTVCDVNDDGYYRDVTGDGEVGQGDVAEFFTKQHRSAWKQPDLFDFSENGAVTHGDVVELFDYVALQ